MCSCSLTRDTSASIAGTWNIHLKDLTIGLYCVLHVVRHYYFKRHMMIGDSRLEVHGRVAIDNDRKLKIKLTLSSKPS
jgi:hypothetical protein